MPYDSALSTLLPRRRRRRCLTPSSLLPLRHTAPLKPTTPFPLPFYVSCIFSSLYSSTPLTPTPLFLLHGAPLTPLCTAPASWKADVLLIGALNSLMKGGVEEVVKEAWVVECKEYFNYPSFTA
ncbi:hypothetical protein E2C01_086615 [Portunus trituberculatus]|uniref:Uncharacterized protein n=1 Tax=Portunus trituberculatus TaxID=210409 RepID=A0A5B7J490_PORTR|nr:hypothetical protein [Portunus trituberculatus]